MEPITLTRPSSEDLRDEVAGTVVVRGGAAYDEARLAWNLAVDAHPAAVAFAESAEDVVAVVRHAAANRVRVAPQGTGHGATAREPLDDAILLRTDRMREVTIDPEARRARVGAGVLWEEVTEAAAPHGLAALAGSSPDVGVVGYTLGGGVSFIGRSYGLAANSVTAIEVVTADGRLLRVDSDLEPDLFWALRGGGGSFGVVTALEFRLYPLAEVYAGTMFFPFERATEVLNAWRELTETAPDALTTVGRLLQFPPIEDIPEPLRGNSFALVEFAYVGSEQDGRRLSQPIRDLGPVMDTTAMVPAPALQHLHMDPPAPVPGCGDHQMLREITPETIDSLVEAAGPGSGSPLLSVEIRHIGGALANPRTDDVGALGSFPDPYMTFAVGIAMAEIVEAVEAYLARVRDALEPWASRREYLNFAEHAGRRTGDMFDAASYERLRSLRTRYDAAGLFVSNHPVD